MTKKVPWYFSNIAWGTPSFFVVTKQYHGYFRKLQNTPTHPLGTFRHVFHQKSTCTPSLRLYSYKMIFRPYQYLSLQVQSTVQI